MLGTPLVAVRIAHQVEDAAGDEDAQRRVAGHRVVERLGRNTWTTRRACRLVRDSFPDLLETDAAILPRIVAIGDVDADEIAFASMAAGELAAEALALPEDLGGLERRMLLAHLVRQWAASPDVRTATGAPLVANSPAAALALADDLARLMDDMVTRQVSWDRLDGLVPEALDPFWQLTLKFLQLARQAWPQILQERGHIEPAARRDALIKAEAELTELAKPEEFLRLLRVRRSIVRRA